MTDDKMFRSCEDVEAHLTPYVDGETTAESRRALDAHLTACPPCREHAAAERDAAALLHARRHELKASAPAGLRARCAAGCTRPSASLTQRAMRWVPLSLAASLVAVIGLVFAFALTSHDRALAAELTLDHMKCFQLVGDRAAQADPAAEQRRWVERQGWPLVVPASSQSVQLRLLTVRRCLSTDGRVAHLMYLWKGDPLSVYVLPTSVGRDGVIDTLGHETVVWTANGRTYAVLAGGHPPGLDQVVAYVKANAR